MAEADRQCTPEAIISSITQTHCNANPGGVSFHDVLHACALQLRLTVRCMYIGHGGNTGTILVIDLAADYSALSLNMQMQ